MTKKKLKFPPRPRSKAARRQQAEAVRVELARLYPDATCALNFRNPFELLIATVLSAQTTDERVNSVTPTLFRAFPGPREFAAARREDVEEILRPLGFFRAKAKSVIGIGAALTEEHGGQVPDTLAELVKLPGVGRKTANVVLGNAFDTPGITVDTHVGRLSRRLGWSRNTDPVKVEADLTELFAPEHWTMLCHRLIYHGRQVCHSRAPECGRCELADLCPSYPLTP